MEIVRYIIDNNTTVRQAAKHFGISKSTVHKDVTERLAQVNPSLAAETRKVLDINKSAAGWRQRRSICISMCENAEAFDGMKTFLYNRRR